MARRIALWAFAGALVAFLWFLYFTWLTWGAYHGGPAFEFNAATDTLVNVTAPIRPLFGRSVAITWYWSLVLNAGIYACIGLMLETVLPTVRLGAARLRH